jgi:glutaredoxin
MDPKDLRALIVIGVAGLVGWPAFQAWRAGQVGEEIARLARPHDIQMVSSETCVYCASARHWFKTHDVPFDECFVERDGACMARYQAQGGPGTPLLFVRGQPQLGFSPQRVHEALLR